MDLSKSTDASLDQLDPQQDLKKQLKRAFLQESCWSLAFFEEITKDLSKSTEASLDRLDPQQELKKQLKKNFLEESFFVMVFPSALMLGT